MAKLTKSVLKGIVKECLVEILTEGIMTTDTPKKSKPVKNRERPKRSAPVVENTKFEERLKETSSVLTNDPLMAAIFEDTARTTLQEQYQGSSQMPSIEQVPGANIQADPEESSQIFEGSSNWATLAFAEKKTV